MDDWGDLDKGVEGRVRAGQDWFAFYTHTHTHTPTHTIMNRLYVYIFLKGGPQKMLLFCIALHLGLCGPGNPQCSKDLF